MAQTESLNFSIMNIADFVYSSAMAKNSEAELRDPAASGVSDRITFYELHINERLRELKPCIQCEATRSLT
jgi:hypothetical protein